MAKTHQEIVAKVQEIYELVRVSKTPISVLGVQSTILLTKGKWLPADVETVSGEVVRLLILQGWKKTAPEKPATDPKPAAACAGL